MMMRWRMIVRRIAFEGASNLVVKVVGRLLDVTEAMRIPPFSTPAGYEIVYGSL